MKNKLLISFVFVLALSSCFWGEENISWDLETQSNEKYDIWIPKEWTVLKNDDNSIPKPKSWEVTLASHSNNITYWFSDSLIVLSQNLNKVITSSDYSILNNVWATKEYSEYTKLDSKEITFADDDKSQLYIFEAKYNDTTRKLKFLQAGKVCNWTYWNLITVALSTDTKDITKYENAIKSFKCK